MTAVRLSVENLKVTLGNSDRDVIDEVSFDVAAGEILGIVGESGSGKTTVALALLAYARRGLMIASGRIRLSGDEVLTLPESELQRMRGKRIAYVAQDPASALNPALTIGWQLREPLLRHGVPEGGNVDKRIETMLEEVRLDSVEDVLAAYPHQLSGGQQQRVMLAMAFACRPEVIVLDEPTTGLDVTTQRRVLDTVRELCRAYGTAAVYVSHDLAVVSELVDAVAVMYAGRVIEYGRTGDVFLAPSHPYTRVLIASLPGVGDVRAREGSSGQAPRPGARPSGCSFALRCRYVAEQCRRAFPPPAELERGHVARCFRLSEVPRTSPLVTVDGSRSVSAEQDEPALLAVQGVSAWYGPKPVLDDVSISVGEGRCVALVGESGSGKTTLAQCVVGLHRGWIGDIAFAGQPLPASLRARSDQSVQAIQYIFQNPYTAMNPRKTIGQLVEQPLRACLDLRGRERRERVARALEDTALSEAFLERYPDELSGGERQRVAIARALVLRPRLLVCDEITSALDVSVQAAIVDLLRRLQQSQNLTLLFITHNLPLVQSLADTTAVMTAGRIIEVGPTERVLQRPAEEYTRNLLADAPKMLDVGDQPTAPGLALATAHKSNEDTQ